MAIWARLCKKVKYIPCLQFAVYGIYPMLLLALFFFFFFTWYWSVVFTTFFRKTPFEG